MFYKKTKNKQVTERIVIDSFRSLKYNRSGYFDKNDREYDPDGLKEHIRKFCLLNDIEVPKTK